VRGAVVRLQRPCASSAGSSAIRFWIVYGCTRGSDNLRKQIGAKLISQRQTLKQDIIDQAAGIDDKEDARNRGPSSRYRFAQAHNLSARAPNAAGFCGLGQLAAHGATASSGSHSRCLYRS
jgi:hypothetical protein